MTPSFSLYLVIDQGSHASRALVFNQYGMVMSEMSVELKTFYPKTDWVEHDPMEVLSSILRSVHGAVSPLADKIEMIESIGFTTQRSSVVCWDRLTGKALSPVISWQDRRTKDWIKTLDDHAGDVHSITGLFLSPHYGASKLRWCLNQLSEVRQAQAEDRLSCGPMVSYILYNMLIEQPFLADPANASRTLLWNHKRLDWEPSLLKLFGISRNLLPRCVPNQHPFGHMLIGSRSIPVTVATGDQCAVLFSVGKPQSDTTYINVGTGAFLQRVVGNIPLETPRLLSSVVWQSDRGISRTIEGTVNGAGSALKYVASKLGITDRDMNHELNHGLATVEETPLFLNGVSGLGSPFWIADFPSFFIGKGGAVEKLVAVVESIVFLIQINLDEMSRYVGSPSRIIITGGLSALDGLCQRLANLSGITVERPEVKEATARGLAYLLTSPSISQFDNVTFNIFKSDPHPTLERQYQRWLKAMEAKIQKIIKNK